MGLKKVIHLNYEWKVWYSGPLNQWARGAVVGGKVYHYNHRLCQLIADNKILTVVATLKAADNWLKEYHQDLDKKNKEMGQLKHKETPVKTHLVEIPKGLRFDWQKATYSANIYQCVDPNDSAKLYFFNWIYAEVTHMGEKLNKDVRLVSLNDADAWLDGYLKAKKTVETLVTDKKEDKGKCHFKWQEVKSKDNWIKKQFKLESLPFLLIQTEYREWLLSFNRTYLGSYLNTMEEADQWLYDHLTKISLAFYKEMGYEVEFQIDV